MWPDHPTGVDLARMFEPDWCRRVPADALVLGTRCGAERVLDKRRHRCRLEPEHRGEHVCWCERMLDDRVDPPGSRVLRAIVASLGLRLAWIVLCVIALGCAGQRGGTPLSPAELTGTWLGSFWQVNAGDTGYIHGTSRSSSRKTEATPARGRPAWWRARHGAEASTSRAASW